MKTLAQSFREEFEAMKPETPAQAFRREFESGLTESEKEAATPHRSE